MTVQSNSTKHAWKRLALLWIGFVFFQVAFMAVDWQLREKGTGLQPMPGGIPNLTGEIMLLIVLVSFSVGAFWYLPRGWGVLLRVAIGILQVVVATALMLGGLLYYGLNWGLDTM